MNDNLIRIGVTGGRDYKNVECVRHVLNMARCTLQDRLFIVVGDAKGLDALVRDWAFANLDPSYISVHYADWDKHGKLAGPIRNEEMAKMGLNLLIAWPGGKGTENMKSLARKYNIQIMEITV